MRMGWRLTAATIVAGMTLAACGSSSSSSDGTDTTVAPVSSTTLPATTVPPATTVAAATTTSAEATTTAVTEVASTTAPSGAGAPDALANFLAAYQELAGRLPAIEQAVQADISGSGDVSGATFQTADQAAGDAFNLTRLVPAGLDLAVYTAVHDAVMMMGSATAAYVYAPGFEASEWPDWVAGMSAARTQLDAMRQAVVSAAAAHPAMATVAAGSRFEAANSLMTLELARRFGHGGPGAELDAPVPTILWIGKLSDSDPSGSGCYQNIDTGEISPPTGDFVDGVGGCAFVGWDGTDHTAEIAAWKANPGGVENLPSNGEFVAFARTEGAWEAIGSVE